MDLTQFLQKAVSPALKTYLPFSLVEGGLPQGSLVELSGSAGAGKLEALLRFLAENPALQVAWVEEGSSTYPCSFPQHGVSLERVLFVNAEEREGESSLLMNSAHAILRSQIFGVLVLLARDSVQQVYPRNHHTLAHQRGSISTNGAFRPEPRRELGEIELRRLQIAAEKSGTTIFILRETPSSANTWPLTAQLQISRAPESGELQVKVLKYKFRPLGSLQQALA